MSAQPERPSFVTRWDLDKTYLRSSFDTLSDLVHSALEQVEDKRTVPGATAVLRELSAARAWVHVLSGSPRQMRTRLSEKLQLDGVSWNELTLKPNLSNLLRLRWSALRDQLGYKLPELLEARARDHQRFGGERPIRELLVGDDSEADAFVYSLYADLCAGEISALELEEVFEAGELRAQAAFRCRRALTTLPRASSVDCILIHLDAQTPPSLFSRYGPRLVPFYNYLQAAFVLLERNYLNEASLLRIAAEFHTQHGFTAEIIARSYLDLLRRGHAVGQAPRMLVAALGSGESEFQGPLKAQLELAIGLMQAPRHSERPPVSRTRPDYIALAAAHRGGKNRRKPGQPFA